MGTLDLSLHTSFFPNLLQAEIDLVAAAHPKEPRPDPLAKNFKCPKVVTVGDNTMLDADMEEACKLMDEISLDVADAQPPVYAEQGQPRGRKPGKGSKLKKVKKAAGGKKKGKRGTKGKKDVKKVNKSGKTKAKKSTPVLVDDKPDKETLGSPEALEPTPKRKTRQTKKRASADASTATPCEDTAPVVAPKKRKSSSKKPAKSAPVESPPVPTPARSMASTPALEASPPEVNPAPRSAAPSLDDGDESIQKPADAIPAPAHCTTNTVYSNAYRRAKASTNSAEEAKKVS